MVPAKMMDVRQCSDVGLPIIPPWPGEYSKVTLAPGAGCVEHYIGDDGLDIAAPGSTTSSQHSRLQQIDDDIQYVSSAGLSPSTLAKHLASLRKDRADCLADENMF